MINATPVSLGRSRLVRSEIAGEFSWVLYFMWKNHAVSHTIVDMPAILSRGLREISDEAAQYEADASEPEWLLVT